MARLVTHFTLHIGQRSRSPNLISDREILSEVVGTPLNWKLRHAALAKDRTVSCSEAVFVVNSTSQLVFSVITLQCAVPRTASWRHRLGIYNFSYIQWGDKIIQGEKFIATNCEIFVPDKKKQNWNSLCDKWGILIFIEDFQIYFPKRGQHTRERNY